MSGAAAILVTTIVALWRRRLPLESVPGALVAGIMAGLALIGPTLWSGTVGASGSGIPAAYGAGDPVVEGSAVRALTIGALGSLAGAVLVLIVVPRQRAVRLAATT